MTPERRNLALGGLFLAALLAAFIAPNFQSGAASLSHPDPVGPTAYSKSAIGHLAFRHLLETLGVPISISESGATRHVGQSDLLIVAEPRSDGTTLEEVRAMLTARNVLLVLPKRTGKPDPHRPYWLGKDELLPGDEIQSVLHLADKDATLVRDASLEGLTGIPALAGLPSIEKPQLIRSKALRPLLATSAGILIGERPTRTGRVVGLSAPDLIANYALARGDNSVLAAALITLLRGKQTEDEEGEVIFDEFSHGFSPKPMQLLAILFQFPFILVTAQIALAAALLAWAGCARLGAPVAEPLPLEAGKLTLIDTGARLLVQSGRKSELFECYFEAIVRDTGRRLRAPRGISLPALLAWLGERPGAPPPPTAAAEPREIWAWRNTLLGKS